MNIQGFYKINELEFPKSILKKKSQYDQKSKCQTESISKPVKTIRFTTEIQKKSKLISSLHSTLLSNKSNKEKEVKRKEKKRNKSDEQKNIKGETEEKVENIHTRFGLFKEKTTGSQKKHDFNLSRLNESGGKGDIISKQKTEVEAEKHLGENGTENVFTGEEKKLELVESEKVITKNDSVDAGVRNNEESHFLEHTSEERKYVRENLNEISSEEKTVKKKRRRRRKRKRGNKGQLNNSNIYSIT